MLTLTEFHPTTSDHSRIAQAFFVGSIIGGVTSVMMTSILLFGFEDYTELSWKDHILAWAPIFTLDCSLLAFLAGLQTWSMEENHYWSIGIVISITVVFVSLVGAVSLNTILVLSPVGRGIKERGS